MADGSLVCREETVMSIRKRDGMRSWALSAAVAGLMIPSWPAFAQVKGFLPSTRNSARKPAAAPPAQAPRLLEASDGAAPAAQIVPTAGEKSETQKQLE